MRGEHRAFPAAVPPCTAAEEQRGCLGGLFAASRAAASLGGFSPAPGSPHRETLGLDGSGRAAVEQLCHKRELQPHVKAQNRPKTCENPRGRRTPCCPCPCAPSAPCRARRGAGPACGEAGVSWELVWGAFVLGWGQWGDHRDSGERGLQPPPPQFPSLLRSLALELLLGLSPTPRWLRGRDTVCPVLPVSPPRFLCARPVPTTPRPTALPPSGSPASCSQYRPVTELWGSH